MLRRLIAKGPPTSLADADSSLALSEEETKEIFSCTVSVEAEKWKSGLLAGAPTSIEAREVLWQALRMRELELPEKEEEEQK